MTENLMERIDELFEQNRGPEAEALMKQALAEALSEGRQEEAVSIINELIGYYRETSKTQDSYAYAEQALGMLDELGYQGTIPYATTLLNAGGAYRAGGRLQDALTAYEQARQIYERELDPEDMLMASLHNNISLVYQELGDFGRAKEHLLTALAIVEKRDAAYEEAVTNANLAATCLNLNQGEEARRYFTRSIRLFEEQGIHDTHYCAAVASMGAYLYQQREYAQAEECFLKAKQGVEAALGRESEGYRRLEENLELCRQAMRQEPAEAEGNGVTGMSLCEAYYERYGKPMLRQRFADYTDRIAVGLVGMGSDCYGYDDAISRDHDWGPGFCLWVTEETYGEIGAQLEEAYAELPEEFEGFRCQTSRQGAGRRGVHKIRDFYAGLLGEENCPEGTDWKVEDIAWEHIADTALSTAVNGRVFEDKEGVFTAIRTLLMTAYPARLRYLKLAEEAARFSQCGQYNYGRLLQRRDVAAARIMASDAVKAACRLLCWVEGVYPPHDKWLLRSVRDMGRHAEIEGLLESALEASGEAAGDLLERAGERLAATLYGESYISDSDPYLDLHTAELIFKSSLSELTVAELAERIARKEFEVFDGVKNLGGRADCQDDWFTFSIMRKSQYLTWERTMLMQYYYDLCRETERGHNLIEEKYGRMMESTAPEEYEKIKDNFPVLDEGKKAVIESIVAIQVDWMENFAGDYPMLAGNARSIHTSEDNLYNTSYETYLRGELGTYSDKMLELYGRFVVGYAAGGNNLAKDTMENSVHLYGYESLEDAEEGLRREAE